MRWRVQGLRSVAVQARVARGSVTKTRFVPACSGKLLVVRGTHGINEFGPRAILRSVIAWWWFVDGANNGPAMMRLSGDAIGCIRVREGSRPIDNPNWFAEEKLL